MSERKCPNCGLWNPPSAIRCDCGFDFAAQSVERPFADSASIAMAKERSEKNLPTILVRAVVFAIVYLCVVFLMYLGLGKKPGGLMLGVAFGLAGAAAAMVKIK